MELTQAILNQILTSVKQLDQQLIIILVCISIIFLYEVDATFKSLVLEKSLKFYFYSWNKFLFYYGVRTKLLQINWTNILAYGERKL